MKNKSKDTKLFSEFPTVYTTEWEDIIHTDLKGADYDKKLIWKTIEGISVKPYYRKEDVENLNFLNVPPDIIPFVRGISKENNWEIRQDIDKANPAQANKIALDAISRGAEAIGFNTMEIENAEDIRTLLESIDLSKVSVHFNSQSSSFLIYKLFLEEIKRQKINPALIKGSFNCDPLSYYLLYGKFNPSGKNNLKEDIAFAKNIINHLPNFIAKTINGQYLNNAGASIVQELAFSLSAASEYLVKFTEGKIPVDDIAPRMQFVFAIGSNYFMEIAKLRAARVLWAKIVEQFEPKTVDSVKMHIHAVTSLWDKSIYDPYVNMLRNTTEAMSAAIGGCDSMSVIPFDSAYKKPDEFSQRISRNLQLLLKEESYFNKVVDPSAGSYYLENHTDSIIDATWKLFLHIEEKGGYIKAIESGFIKEEIDKTCQQRDMDIAMRKQIILGTNQYPNLKENMLDKIKPHSNISELCKLKQYRGAQSFEALRLSTEAFEKDGHKRPTVFLFTYGKPEMHKARASFTTNFFGCAGYTIIDNTGFKNIKEGIDTALKSDADIVVFCSSDEEYEELTKETLSKLKSANPDLKLIVAGNPVKIIDKLKQIGVDDFINVRSNVLETLGKYQHLMGII